MGGKNKEEWVTLLADNFVFILVCHLLVTGWTDTVSVHPQGADMGQEVSYLSEGVGNASNRVVRRSLGAAAFLHPDGDRTVVCEQ